MSLETIRRNTHLPVVNSRRICHCLVAPRLVALAETLLKEGKHRASSLLFACSSLAGWDTTYLPSTVAAYFIRAADIPQAHAATPDHSFKCSLRLLICLLVINEPDQATVCGDNLARIKTLKAMGVGAVIRPSQVRLAQFHSTSSAASKLSGHDGLDHHIAALETELAGRANARHPAALRVRS